MKRIFFSVLLLIPFWVNGQVYHPLVDSGAVWNQEILVLDFFDYNKTDVIGGRFLIGSDTIIQGLTYSLLKFRDTYYYEYKYGFPPSAYGWNINDSLHMIGALREDSDRKIWMRMFPGNVYNMGIPTDVDTLLYDFSLEAGDTFHLNPTWWTIVQSIDSFQLLNGEWRKRFHFSPWMCWATSWWIEGVGSDGGLLGNYFCPFESAPVLTCFGKNGELLYEALPMPPIISVSCDSISIPNGIQSSGSSLFNLEISPNPASDFLTIYFSSPDFLSAQIKITDMLGRNFFSDGIKSDQPLQISMEKFSGNNMLFCQLWQNGKLIAVKKVLIQR